jgi:hypothetical protein
MPWTGVSDSLEQESSLASLYLRMVQWNSISWCPVGSNFVVKDPRNFQLVINWRFAKILTPADFWLGSGISSFQPSLLETRQNLLEACAGHKSGPALPFAFLSSQEVAFVYNSHLGVCFPFPKSQQKKKKKITFISSIERASLFEIYIYLYFGKNSISIVYYYMRHKICFEIHIKHLFLWEGSFC